MTPTVYFWLFKFNFNWEHDELPFYVCSWNNSFSVMPLW